MWQQDEVVKTSPNSGRETPVPMKQNQVSPEAATWSSTPSSGMAPASSSGTLGVLIGDAIGGGKSKASNAATNGLGGDVAATGVSERTATRESSCMSTVVKGKASSQGCLRRGKEGEEGEEGVRGRTSTSSIERYDQPGRYDRQRDDRQQDVRRKPGFACIVVTCEMLRDVLGPEPYESEVAARVAVPGTCTGLAWTPTGGELLFIECTSMPGNGTLKLTGKLGEVRTHR